MGFFSKMFRSRDAPNKRNKRLEDFIKGVDLDGAGATISGASVNEDAAMRTSAVYACVKILAETVASLPLHLYKTQKGKRERADNHPLFDCLYSLPNDEMTSFQFREVMMTALLLWGNAYARIVRDRQGHTKELWYLRPDKMEVKRDESGSLKYEYSCEDSTQTVTYNARQIFHVRGLSHDGVKGLSPINQMREAIGLTLATEQFGASFFGNGARPGGFLEVQGTISDPEKLRKQWEAVYKGAINANKVAILEGGTKYHTLSIPPNDSQFLETRKFQVNEICRIFRVPPHLVGDLEKATFSNIEHSSIDFVVHSIRPWLVRWEQEISRSLLSKTERTLYFAKFNVDGLLRGDYTSRMRGYAIGRQNGWLSANDIRGLEDMNPIPDGDQYLVNGNMANIAGGAKGESTGEPKNTSTGGV